MSLCPELLLVVVVVVLLLLLLCIVPLLSHSLFFSPSLPALFWVFGDRRRPELYHHHPPRYQDGSGHEPTPPPVERAPCPPPAEKLRRTYERLGHTSAYTDKKAGCISILLLLSF